MGLRSHILRGDCVPQQLHVQIGGCRAERTGRLPKATRPSTERQSWGWCPGPIPVPQPACPSHCPGPASTPAFPPVCLSACLPICLSAEPELIRLLLQFCFLKPLFENSFPCQEPRALGAVKSNLMEHRSTVYRGAREMGPDSVTAGMCSRQDVSGIHSPCFHPLPHSPI